MGKILAVLLGALALGALLAAGAGHWPLPAGVVGALAMLAAALAVRRRWGLLADAAPGSPERALWVSLAGNAVVAAHLLVMLWRIGPTLVLHTPAVHAMAIDGWTLVAGTVLAYWIARDPQPRADERDRGIAALGLCAAHYALLVLLAVGILLLGFVHEGWIGQLSRPSIAHWLILAVVTSVVVDALVRLRAYAEDAMHDDAALEDPAPNDPCQEQA